MRICCNDSSKIFKGWFIGSLRGVVRIPFLNKIKSIIPVKIHCFAYLLILLHWKGCAWLDLKFKARTGKSMCQGHRGLPRMSWMSRLVRKRPNVFLSLAFKCWSSINKVCLSYRANYILVNVFNLKNNLENGRAMTYSFQVIV